MTLLPVALRAHAVKNASRKKNEPPKKTARKTVPYSWPYNALIIDTETTTDASQRLLFGSYRYCRFNRQGNPECVEEGLFHADDLPQFDPTGFDILRMYAEGHRQDLDKAGGGPLTFLSRREFVNGKFKEVAIDSQGLVVGFNLPFDLSRLAVRCGDARGHYRGGFSFQLFDYWDEKSGEFLENKYLPRICIKHIDSKRSFIRFTRPRENTGVSAPTHTQDEFPGKKNSKFQGNFLDLRTLSFALSDRNLSLASAGELFGCDFRKERAEEHGVISAEYIGYNRSDVRATQSLLHKLREEVQKHPAHMNPCQTYSPATIAKAYLKAMGISPPLEKFSDFSVKHLGHAMTAYYGGRAECRIRQAEVPVVVVDFLSMYPTVNSLLQLWQLLTAEKLHVDISVRHVKELLENVTIEKCSDRAFWPNLRFFAKIKPADDVLPIRAQYDLSNGAYNIGVNHLTSSESMWYAGPDLVAAVLLCGHVPEVIEAFRLVPDGKEPDLHPIKIRDSVEIDPVHDDFFKNVIEARMAVRKSAGIADEERERLVRFLKVLANAGSYGVFAEANPQPLAKDKRSSVTVHALDDPFTTTSKKPEQLGPLSFPPIAALITSAARLMLALLERCVIDLGGTYAFCDTDSMAIVATEAGELVPCADGPYSLSDGTPAIQALSEEQVASIVDRFSSLNPYSTDLVPGSILKIEDENYEDGSRKQLYCHGISAKRYALYN